jgi:hypothetical protein
MLYVAGRNDVGYFLLEDVVDENGNFKGFNNIPVEKRHGFFRGTWDGDYDGGDGIFDESYSDGGFPYNSESGITNFKDGTGRDFLVDGDGTVTPKDMRKSLGTFAGGSELVFWLIRGRWGDHYDEPVLRDWILDFIYFNKPEWNRDYYQSCEPPPADGSPFDKIFHLGMDRGTEGECEVEGGWLQDTSHSRLDTYFGLDLVDTPYYMPITPGEKYHHFIVGAPKDDPNQWILGIEQNNNQHSPTSDVDCNDFVFKIERKTGGVAELDPGHAITTGSADVSFTGVTLEVWDYIPCGDQNRIKYELTIDNGVSWVEVTTWDEIYASDTDKNVGAKIDNAVWQPGSPAYTYRTTRIDFAGLGLGGHEIRWRATMMSQDEACEPKILDLAIEASWMRGGEVSRASPVVNANMLYSGSYEISDGSWSNDELRGHLKATRIYDPSNPGQTDATDLWDAGAVLNAKSPDLREIFFPHVTITAVPAENLGFGDGTTTSFSGTLSHHPVIASTLTITDQHESFTDKHTDVLEGNLGGSGNIDRFSGEFTVTFNSPPAADVPIVAQYTYYATSSGLLHFKPNNVTAAMLGIDNSLVIGQGYTYDFDGDGEFDPILDRNWLVNWVRGFKDGASTPKDWLLGAIDHSVPAVQTPPSLPDWYYGTAVTRQERESFLAFSDAEAQKTRPTVVYVGARDGMLHAFDGGGFRHGNNSATDPITEQRGYYLDYGTGEELWAFIPTNLLSRLKNNVLQGDDQAYVDASPALADVFINSSWKTVLLSAQGNGGDTIFCLDVTDPHNPNFLWEFADPDFFRSRSSPPVGKIGRILVDGQAVWVAFFVSGKTADANLYPSIYMINVADGSLVKRVMLDAEAGGIGGVPSGQPTIIDSDANGYLDRMYIGTDKGYLYKVNIPDDPDVVNYEFSHCVINRDFSDESDTSVFADWRYQPIFGSPVVIVDNGMNADGSVAYNVKLFFGTGDSPYFDEDIDMANTRYLFFAYNDQSKKGEQRSEQKGRVRQQQCVFGLVLRIARGASRIFFGL